jgi:hypothetical protein
MIADQDELAWIESYEEAEENDFDGVSEQKRKEYEAKFRTFGVLGKLHNVVIHIRRSPQHIKQFKQRAGRRVPLDNRTRWNSWWAMLEVALKVQESISWYISVHLDTIDKGDQLSVQDWAQLRTIHSFLEIFKSATLKLEGGRVTLDRVLYMMDLLKLHYSKSLVRYLSFFILYKILIIFRKTFLLEKSIRISEPESYEARQNSICIMRSSSRHLFIQWQLFFILAIVRCTVRSSG